MVIRETLQTPVTYECDVLVCGGGIAGVSAALAAARQGKSVMLLEKQHILGGLGTAGLITYYLPLCDGYGKQVSFGIAEELLRLSIQMGAEARYPANWLDSDDPAGRTEHDARYETRYNPYIFAVLMEQLLKQESVRILYGTYAVGVSTKGDKIHTVMIENKTGRQAIAVKSVVDATGDCDIAVFAGAPTALFQQGNLLASWYYALDKNGYDLHSLGYADMPENRKTDADRERTKHFERFSGVDGEEISEMMQKAHRLMLDDWLKKREKDATVIPTTISSIPQLRMTRKLVGEYCQDDTEMHQEYADSVGMVSDWRERGPVYEVPFGTMVTKTVKNLVVAGRCTSVTDSMWDIMRVIPCCAVTGEAAGVAAAMTDDMIALDVTALQAKLVKNGVVLHERDL
ncbi:MAG: FAD-dependent oxidoreductase [Clostridia bacterium]|nr:FAD-dependent oxidoreductase [Clostridia bacterium]